METRSSQGVGTRTEAAGTMDTRSPQGGVGTSSVEAAIHHDHDDLPRRRKRARTRSQGAAISTGQAATTTAAAASPPSVASSIWHMEGIVGLILQRLPPVALITARRVCKQWNAIVLSQRCHNSSPCLYMYFGDDHPARMSDPVMWAWVTVSIPQSTDPDPEEREVLRLLDCSGSTGLLTFEVRTRTYGDGDGPYPSGFWVGNPMTNMWKAIPEMDVSLHTSMANREYVFVLVSEGPPARYKIVALGSAPLSPGPCHDLVAVVYDSGTGSGGPAPASPVSSPKCAPSCASDGSSATGASGWWSCTNGGTRCVWYHTASRTTASARWWTRPLEDTTTVWCAAFQSSSGRTASCRFWRWCGERTLDAFASWR